VPLSIEHKKEKEKEHRTKGKHSADLQCKGSRLVGGIPQQGPQMTLFGESQILHWKEGQRLAVLAKKCQNHHAERGGTKRAVQFMG